MKSTHRSRVISFCFVAIGCLLALGSSATAQVYQLDTAIGKLRRIDQSKMSDTEKERMARDIGAAWDSIKSYGPEGIARLKKEVQTVDQGAAPDNFFKLNAAALLWIMGKADQADAIAAIWNNTPLTAQYNYVFYTAFEAATTHDPRVIPMLKAVLRDRDGHTYIPAHSLTIEWPLAQEFIWGAYGAKGMPILAELLSSSTDQNIRATAMHLLSISGYSKALPAIREIAVSGKGIERISAIRALGIFGHPQDFESLIAGVMASDPEVAAQYAFALFEYDDLRAVPILIPLLRDEDAQLPGEAFSALAHLADRPAMDAVVQFCGIAKQQAYRDYCTNNVDPYLARGELDRAKYTKLSPTEKDAALSRIRALVYEDFLPQKNDQALTHDQLIEALNEWKSQHRAFSDQKNGLFTA